MGAHLELLSGVLVLVGCAQDGDDFLFGGKRNGTGNPGARALRRLHDAFCRLIDEGVLIRLELDTDLLIGHVFTSLQVEAHIHRAVCAAKIYFCGAAPPPRPREADEPASVLRTGPRELPGDHDQQLPASSHAATTKVYTMFFFNARTFLLFTDFSQKEFWLYSQLSRARIFTRPRVCRFSFIVKKEGRFSAFYLMMSFSLFDEMQLPCTRRAQRA